MLILNSFYHNIKPLLIINKIDLIDDNELIILEKNLQFLKNIDIDYILISTEKMYNIEKLKDKIKNKIVAFAGPSGAGKSSIINTIQKDELLETAEISKKINRGKHTTKQTKLLHLEIGGYVADTPGFSSLDIPAIKNFDEYIALFPEYNNLSYQCQFKNCKHIKEPKCAVKNMINENQDMKLRYDFYVNTYQELMERWNNYYD